jgi:hypothetical protein
VSSGLVDRYRTVVLTDAAEAEKFTDDLLGVPVRKAVMTDIKTI